MGNSVDAAPLHAEPIAGVIGAVVHVEEPWTLPLGAERLEELHDLVARNGVVVVRGGSTSAPGDRASPGGR